MAITQLPRVKELPYLVGNTLSLLTCLPLALSVLLVLLYSSEVGRNIVLYKIGIYSYEIYLVHAFTLEVIEKSMFSIFVFISVTAILSIGVHIICKETKKIGEGFNENRRIR